MFPAYSVEAQAPGVHGYALILLVTVVEAHAESTDFRSGWIWIRCLGFAMPYLLMLT